jgi:hypothetical protein
MSRVRAGERKREKERKRERETDRHFKSEVFGLSHC